MDRWRAGFPSAVSYVFGDDMPSMSVTVSLASLGGWKPLLT